MLQRRFQASFRGLWSIAAREIAQGRPQRGDFDRDHEFSHGLQDFCTEIDDERINDLRGAKIAFKRGAGLL
jgi:hypothetical protein